MKLNRTALAVSLALGTVLAACGSNSAVNAMSSKPVTVSSTTTPQVENQVTGYAATGNGWALFLQFTKVGHKLNGTIESAQLTSAGTSVNAQTDSFTGTVSGQSITLNGGFSFDPNSISGTLVGLSIDLELPVQNGQLYPVEFKPSTVAKYDASVAALQRDAFKQAAINSAAAAAAAAQQQANSQVDAAAQAVFGDESNISDGISSLQTDVSNLAQDVSNTHSDFNTASQDLQQTQSDSTSNPTNTCYDAGNVSYDFESMQYDQNSLSYDLSGGQNDLTSLKQAMSAISTDWANLISAEQADPGYTPNGGLPTGASESQSLQSGGTEVSQFNSAVAADQNAITNLINQGQGLVSQANQLCNQSG